MDTLETEVPPVREHGLSVGLHKDSGHDLLAVPCTDTLTHGALRR